MRNFNFALQQLIDQLDPAKHATPIRTLSRCRRLSDLEALARDGWLDPDPTEPRLKLIRHGSGTFLVVAYKEGWSTRVGMQGFSG